MAGSVARQFHKELHVATLDGKHILIVDDDPDILNAMKIALQETGATITTAPDGDAAIRMAEKSNPDLVVLDAMLPKRSGFLVMDRLKGNPTDRSKPRVIMITGNAGKRHQDWAESRGVDDYIAKPFRMERLLKSAEKLLAQ
jgi:DNA-binding response OmpR family regulator